jgi:2-methylisocitrate lyase-like PEP mutase family enzyme
MVERITWREAMARQKPLLLPVAHDALTARLIALAGFIAYQIGGFALSASLHAVPDVDLEHFGEKSAAARNIIGASPLPVMVDGDDGYGDAKNVTRVVRDYERMGASAIFIEDQVAPKKCGHMDDKHIVPAGVMEGKIRAATAARSDQEFFVLARTDAIQPEGLDRAIARAERYLKAGADGVYLEGPTSYKELAAIGKAFRGTPLATSILERGGKTPWISPEEMGEMGFTMILYPTTLLFRLTKALQDALADLKAEKPITNSNSVDMGEFETIVDLPYWAGIEKRFGGREE